MGWRGMGLYGATGSGARFRAAAVGTDGRCAGVDRQGADPLQLGADPRRRHRLGAQLQPALVRLRAGACGWRRGDRQELAAPLDRQGASDAGAPHAVRFPVCGHSPAHRERCANRLRALDGLRRTRHGADPAQQPLQRGQRQRPDGRHPHGVLFHRLGRSCDHARNRDLATLSGHERRQGPRRTLQPLSQREQPFLAGPGGNEGRQLHRYQRLPQPGYCDVGDHGPHRRPQRRPAGRQRFGHRRIPQTDGRSGAAFQDGEAAIGTGDGRVPPGVCSFQAIVPKSVDWREFKTRPVGGGLHKADPELESNYQIPA